MKKLLFILALILCAQNIDLLEAMRQDPLGGYRDMRNSLEKEAECAAATINDWLTLELAQELVEKVQERDCETNQIIYLFQLNLEKLSQLPIGQQIVLTAWADHPRYWVLVVNHFKMEIVRIPGGFAMKCGRPLLIHALYVHNFGKDVFAKANTIARRGNVSLLKLENFIPQLEHLRYQSLCMNDLEFKEELKKYEADVQDCFFALQYPYFFVDFLENYAENNKNELIKLFLEYGLDVNCPLMNLLNEANDTMLHRAVLYDYFNTALLLLTHQADPLQVDNDDESAWSIILNKIEEHGGNSSKLNKDAQKIYKMLCYSVPKNRKNDLKKSVNNNNNNNDNHDSIIIEENFDNDLDDTDDN